ncbi:armadillo repeat-containing protein 2 [Eupeodes corollae]|uniref:armadillo repeat-containing protein 2 n=1 Tax=Eupeodes corollae TaxID=290404 RepID=UPI00248FA5A8|nr:armadillo repeat-containing protein 2 [Eupeodes corollae]
MESSTKPSEDSVSTIKLGHQKMRRRSRSMTPSCKDSCSDSGSGSFDLKKNMAEVMASGDFRGSYNQLHSPYDSDQSGSGFRKTTAEIISEARTMLHGTSNSGVRLVSTRRPITPRDPRRQLYGKVAPPGRPPSAFSLRYLQLEVRNLPALDPIPMPTIDKDSNKSAAPLQSMGPKFESFDTKYQRKLPALPQKVRTPPRENGQTPNPSKTKLTTNKNASNHFDLDSTSASSKPSEPHPLALPAFCQDENENNLSNIGINILSSRKLFARNYDLLAQTSTETLTDMLKEHSGIKECTDETIQHIYAILLELYNRIRSTHGTWRSAVLGGLYGLVECTSPKILLAIARVVLGLRVTGSNLTGACKLVFKVARNEANDYLFDETDVPELLIDGLGRASPLDEPEACIYGYGAVRFLTSDSQQNRETDVVDYNKNDAFWELTSELPPKPSTAPERDTKITTFQFRSKRQSSLKQISIAQRLSKHGAVQLMVLHLQIVNEAGARKKLTGPPLHALYQLSAALRALAGAQQAKNIEFDNLRAQSAHDRASADKMTRYFGETSPEVDFIHLELACPHLIKAAEISIGELEIQANIIRTLSVLSEDMRCCEALAEFTGKIGMLLGPSRHILSDSPKKLLSILSRLGYILGNILARFNSARMQFYQNDVAMEYLFDALVFYSKQKLTLQNHLGDTVVDVLIKLIRVIANMGVNCEVGCGLGQKNGLGDILLHILKRLNQIRETNMNPEMQELLNATLGALHNLCFYQDQSPDSVPISGENCEGSISNILVDLGPVLCQNLRNGPDPVRIEAIRVLGNLSRNQIARMAYCKAGGLRTIVHCLSSPEYNLRTSAVGVLVNLLGDWENRTPFMELKGQLILMEMLKMYLQQEDWLVAGIICQAFWNLLIDTHNVINVLGEKLTDELSDILAEYLDEHRFFKGVSPDSMWEQFALVATDLLERIQSNLGSPFQSYELDSGTDEDDVHIEGLGGDQSI